MRNRTLTAAAIIGIVTLLFVTGVAATTGRAPADASAAAMPPVSAGTDRPTAAGTQSPATTTEAPAGAARGFGRPASVDDATYAREKAAAETAAAPTATRVAAPSAPAASITTSFAGLNRQTAAGAGLVWNPPDTIVGKSPNRVLEGANSALRLFTNAGAAIQTLSLNTFFGAPIISSDASKGGLFDPKVYFDRNATNPRFFVVALQTAGKFDSLLSNNVSRIWVAVSRSPDPSSLSSGWCRYNIEGRREIGTSNESWSDFPAIGAGRDSFSFALNTFRFSDNAFRFAVVHVWNKLVAENNASSCPSVPRFTFQPAGSTAGNFGIFTIQPAQHYTTPSSFAGTTNPAYYLSTTRGSSNAYHVWRVRNVAGGSPTLNTVVLTGAAYGIPPSSPQPNTSIRIDTGDDRMLQVAGIGNTVIGTFTALCNFTSTPNESCSRSPRVAVGQNSSGGLTASILENTFSGFGDNIFVYRNSIATNPSLQSASTWESSGSGRFLRSSALIKNVNAGWTTISNYAIGTCSEPATAPSTTIARSGDYSGAQLDPSDVKSFFLAGERAVTINSACQWQTTIVRLVP